MGADSTPAEAAGVTLTVYPRHDLDVAALARQVARELAWGTSTTPDAAAQDGVDIDDLARQLDITNQACAAAAALITRDDYDDDVYTATTRDVMSAAVRECRRIIKLTAPLNLPGATGPLAGSRSHPKGPEVPA